MQKIQFESNVFAFFFFFLLDTLNQIGYSLWTAAIFHLESNIGAELCAVISSLVLKSPKLIPSSIKGREKKGGK